MTLPTSGCLLALLLTVALPSGVAAQSAPVPPGSAASSDAGAEAQARALFTEVMSPFCPGLTLADCPSPDAFTMRGDIERRLKAGESREAIVEELVKNYGTQILADPSATPIGSIVWGVPIALSAAAALGLAFFLRRATRARAPEVQPAVESDRMRSRVDDELAALD